MPLPDTLDRPFRPGPRPRPGPSPMASAATAAALAPVPTVPRPHAEPAVRPRHLRVVAPAERVRRRLTPANALVATLGVFLVLFAVAVAQTALVHGQGRLDRLDAQLSVEQARYQQLRLEVAQLEAPDRIVDAAQQQGMVTPDDLVYLQPEAAGVDAMEGAGTIDPVVAGTTEQGAAWSTVKPLLGESAP